MGRGPKPAKAKVETKVPVSRKSPKNNDAKVRDLEKRLAEAQQREAEALKREAEEIEQQTATADILRVISSSPSDAQPVFETIAVNALRLCDAKGAVVVRYDGELLHVVAYHNVNPEAVELVKRQYPLAPDRHLPMGRAVLEGIVVQVPDLQAAEEFSGSVARQFGARGHVSIPLLHQGRAIGAIGISRPTLGPFSDRQVALLQTFADQAVIAIENVRLFNETKEALEQQTATSEILRVISRSPTELQPVLAAVTESASRVCGADDAMIRLVDGDALRLVTHYGPLPDLDEIIPRNRGSATGRAIADRRAIHIHDLAAESEGEFPVGRSLQRRFHHRTVLAVPLLREGVAIGGILIRRQEVRPFADKQIALLQTFADQAVIAIENVRLFTELQEKNRALTTAHAQVSEALEQQTATSEVLKVISRSAFNLQPVLENLIENAVRLCGADKGFIYRQDAGLYRAAVSYGHSPEWLQVVEQHPIAQDRGSATGRAVLERRVVHIDDILADPEYRWAESHHGERDMHRTILAVPMLREGAVIGVIVIRRTLVQPFTDKQIELVTTFADQAVIAIENVRLFTELQEKNRALTAAHGQISQALEQQTATADILSVISRSPTDVQPVFDAIVASAVRLCDGLYGVVLRVEGGLIHIAAHHDWSPEGLATAHRLYPMPLSEDNVSAQAVREGRIIHAQNMQHDPTLPATSRELATSQGYQTLLVVPMLHDAQAIGTINVFKTDGPFSDSQIQLLQTFADQAVIAIENVRLFKELEARNRDLTESLDRQTATAEILRVISGSPTDVQPVFDAIARSASRLLGAAGIALTHVREGQLHRVADHYEDGRPAVAVNQYRHTYPRPLDDPSPPAVAVRTGQMFSSPDTQNDPRVAPAIRENAAATGYRRLVIMPMLRDGKGIGAIHASRAEAGWFSEPEVALLQTFADQAVIAIENVRLFTELQEKNRALTQAHAQVTEALEQQTATGDILGAISGSPTDAWPVFETIVRHAAQLCDARDASLYQREGDVMRCVANYGTVASALVGATRPITRGTGSGRAILDRRTIHLPDVLSEVGEFFDVAAAIKREGIRAVLSVPLLREGVPIGAITVRRTEVRPYSDKQIKLIETFADQAVIAIENVRLFKELEARNAELTETLARQTATGEVLRVISQAQTDAQPVFDVIARSARRLCGAAYSQVQLYDGELIQLATLESAYPEGDQAIRAVYPLRVGDGSAGGRAIATRAVVQIPDLLDDRAYAFRSAWEASGLRSLLAVPMLRDGEPIGTIGIGRTEPGAFPQTQIDLLRTFADQAVIAIENVRLFKELDARTQDLARSVGELRALSEVGQAISSTLDLQAVLSTIVAHATQLSGTDAGVIYEYDEPREIFVPRATEHLEAAILQTMLATPVRKGEGATGRLAEVQEPVQVPDILAAPAESRVRGALVRAGYRALLAVPLVREGHLIGGLTVIRRATGAFAPEDVELLQTFATQSALAIQNARLFREIEDKSRQLEVASQHKSEFLANMSHELRTPLNAIIGFSEVLSEKMFGGLNEKQEEYSKDIHASGQHLLSLINDILDLSKIEAGRMELELSDFHLPTALDSALTLVRERAGRRGIALQMSVDDRLGQIQADERKVRQVVLNLLSNSIKFTPEGGRIEVRATPQDGLVEISVSDTGVGIAPEDQEAVFEEFRQVGTADKKVEGTGLGLTLCRKFVELHGGRIWVKSQVGVGSTFTFTIPMRRAFYQ